MVNKKKKDIIWIEKYRPTKLKDYNFNKDDDIKKKINKWMKGFIDKDQNTERFLLFHGDPGVGKTTLAHIILKKYGFIKIEHNASVLRSSKFIDDITKNSSSYSLDNLEEIMTSNDNSNKKTIGLIFDEIDGCDKKAIDNLIRNIVGIKTRSKKTTKLNKLKYPIVCTCNSIKDKKMLNLIKNSLTIYIDRPSVENLIKIGMKIKKKENLDIVNEQIELIAKSVKRDYRSFINLLYMYNINKFIDLEAIKETSEISNNYGKSPLKRLECFINDKEQNLIYCKSKYDIDNSVFHITSFNSEIYYFNLYGNYMNILNNRKLFQSKKKKDYNIINKISNNYLESQEIYKYINRNQEFTLYNYFNMTGIIHNIYLLRNYNYKDKCNMYLQHHNRYNKLLQDKAINRKKIIELGEKYDITNIKDLYYINIINKKLPNIDKKFKDNLDKSCKF